MTAGGGRLFAVLALLLFPVCAAAQIPQSAQPGRERERFVEPQAPRAQPGGDTIALPSTVAPAGADRITLTISRVVITGATVYGDADLAPLYADMVGPEVSLAAVYDLAQRITAKYGAGGYVLSRAVVPPQNFGRHGATIRIQVVEGYVDKVVWPMERLSRYQNFFDDYAARIVADRPANVRTLERYLLLANDLPGLKFSTTLKPSPTHPNASILIVEVKEKAIDAIARIDNRGTQARGPWQYLGSVTANNLFGAHEAFTVTYAGTFQLKELQYVQANFRKVLNSEGLTVFASASYGTGKPDLGSLPAVSGYKTRSSVIEAGLAYPVIRSREANLTLSALGFLTHDQSITDLLDPFKLDRLRGFRVKADGDWADSFLGINQVNVTFSQGVRGLGSTDSGVPGDPTSTASTNAGRVDFSKIEVTASRVQPLPMNFSFFVAAYGQYAFTPLLVSEQCSYGGRFFGRAYDPSELLGDRCWAALAELRHDFATPWKQLTKLQAYAFADHGDVTVLQPAAGTPGHQFGSSVGAGVRAAWEDTYTADLSIAKAVAGTRDDWRAFVILGAKY